MTKASHHQTSAPADDPTLTTCTGFIDPDADVSLAVDDLEALVDRDMEYPSWQANKVVSMTRSAPEDVPRGMDLLLSPNRTNVAASRAQWRTVVVRSEALTDFMPTSPNGLTGLGRFLAQVA